MVFKIHIFNHRAKITYIQVVKIYTLYHCIFQLVFIPETEIINGYFFKYHRPRLAYRLGRIARFKIIYDELNVRAAILLLFQVNGTIVKLDQFKIQALVLYAAEKGKAV